MNETDEEISNRLQAFIAVEKSYDKWLNKYSIEQIEDMTLRTYALCMIVGAAIYGMFRWLF